MFGFSYLHLSGGFWSGVFQNTICHFTQWCTENYLELNVDKTKDLVIGTTNTGLNPLLTDGLTVEAVDKFT